MTSLEELPSWCGPSKAILDFILALGLFVIALPVMIFIGVLVRITSRGPALYSQIRVGKHGKLFWIYKIRTMYNNCERGTGARWSLPGDPRITPLGHILRATHLDELPQLWNVLRGDMSLVGPRPERPEFVPTLKEVLPEYEQRLAVRPGVTGLAQVQLPPDTNLESVQRKLTYDLHYIQHGSCWLDLRLMVCTGMHMFGVPYRWLAVGLVIPGPSVVEDKGTEKPAVAPSPSVEVIR